MGDLQQHINACGIECVQLQQHIDAAYGTGAYEIAIKNAVASKLQEAQNAGMNNDDLFKYANATVANKWIAEPLNKLSAQMRFGSRKLYQGCKGGRFYINKFGNKTYV